MKTLESVRGAIRTAEELLSVAKTMKAVAAGNIRQYESAVESLSAYVETVELGFQAALREEPDPPRVDESEGGAIAALVFGSDQGMVGRFNRDIASHSRERLDEEGETRVVAAIGERVAPELESESLPVETTFELPGSIRTITNSVREIVLLIDRWRSERQISRVFLFHHRPLVGASYEPRSLQLLPIDPGWLRALKSRPWPTRNLPMAGSRPRQLLSALTRQHLLVRIHRALAESQAAENASRLAAMQAAERNVEERLDELRSDYHRRRQGAITEELLDVTAGFEVLRGSRE